MKTLNKRHKEIILGFGYPKEDLRQIEKALKYTTFTLCIKGKEDEIVSLDKAVEILGEKEFLSGMCRSAFHWTAMRNNDEIRNIHFNSSKLFE